MYQVLAKLPNIKFHKEKTFSRSRVVSDGRTILTGTPQGFDRV
jgi:hypothetical protein